MLMKNTKGVSSVHKFIISGGILVLCVCLVFISVLFSLIGTISDKCSITWGVGCFLLSRWRQHCSVVETSSVYDLLKRSFLWFRFKQSLAASGRALPAKICASFKGGQKLGSVSGCDVDRGLGGDAVTCWCYSSLSSRTEKAWWPSHWVNLDPSEMCCRQSFACLWKAE